MIRGLAVFVVLASSQTAAAEPPAVFNQPATVAQLSQTLAPLTVTLREARSLRGVFTQRKILKEIPRPLVAEGTFLFVRERGIVWRTTLPFVSELVITPDYLSQRDGGDANGVRLPANSNPAVRVISEIFMAVFGLDFTALDGMFALFSQPPKNSRSNWVLGLRPRATAMAGAMQSIVVEGRDQVRRVTLRDTRGDVTEITLRDTVASNLPPTADDLRPFAP